MASVFPAVLDVQLRRREGEREADVEIVPFSVRPEKPTLVGPCVAVSTAVS